MKRTAETYSLALIGRMRRLLRPQDEPNVAADEKGIAAALKVKKVARVLVAADETVCRLNLTSRLEQALTAERIDYTLVPIEAVGPSEQDAVTLWEKYLAADAQALIAVGGGTVIDCAKAAAYKCATAGAEFVRHERPGRDFPLIAALPTVAGAGSEGTPRAVIWGAEGLCGEVLEHPRLLPALTAHVPELTVSVPGAITAEGAMIALTQAIEAAIHRCTGASVQRQAREAISGIARHLHSALKDSSDLTSRLGLQRAAFEEAQASVTAGCGYVSALAFGVSSLYGTPVGVTCAALLPAFLKDNLKDFIKPLANLARMGVMAAMDATDAQAAESFLAWLNELVEENGWQHQLPDLKNRDLYALADFALRHVGLTPPVRLTRRDLMALLARHMAPQAPAATEIPTLVADQKAYFAAGHTLPLTFRREALLRLQNALRTREKDVENALKTDLGKGSTESYLCETGLVQAELKWMIRHLPALMRKKYVLPSITQIPGCCFSLKVPFGTALIMSPWNYPFLLTITPLIGAIAAGNCCVVKPSAYAPATAGIIREIISDCFPREFVAVVEGGREENQQLLDQPFDKIFFTGGVTVGREVLRRAAERVTPVTLELGGKSPVYVDKTADIAAAAKRIIMGKLLNSGQTCVAPDYILADEDIYDDLIARLQESLQEMVGRDALTLPDYPHIINRRHFDRIMGLIDPAKVVCGGKADAATLKIQPTILQDVTLDDAVMQEEIFGPLLPVIRVQGLQNAINCINANATPLALYLFTRSKYVRRLFLTAVPFGGGCINDTVVQVTSSRMGFGGVGLSGMGNYHGRRSFDCFSHEKNVVRKALRPDAPLRYRPYSEKKDRLIRRLMR